MGTRTLRKAIYASDAEEGRALFARAPIVHVATTTADARPILRTLHAVVHDDWLAFHGAPAGEKMEGIGRLGVFSAEEIVASIPSFFLDPVRACPATTYYVSAQIEGRIEEIDDVAIKASVLETLMTKYQPEGGYRAIRGDDPLYKKAVAGLLVAGVRLDRDRIVCKAKLGQNRRPEERRRVLEQMWKRGTPEDVRAIALLVNRFPEIPRPSFLEPGLSCALDENDLDEAARLLEGAYWLEGIPYARMRAALSQSQALVGARDEEGRLIGFARALTDGKVAWIFDVIVAERARRRGVGQAIMRLLLDHPAVRSALQVRLNTRDAMSFYEKLGFSSSTLANGIVAMARRQNVPPAASPA
jgi:ribosomal protein S18 acetylase RimI-like enzyme/nitroimidazol reductase NimA-like FMN-containing flavoprotein (pyridoxamine 5'-phosphate oxidase superfamily)